MDTDALIIALIPAFFGMAAIVIYEMPLWLNILLLGIVLVWDPRKWEDK